VVRHHTIDPRKVPDPLKKTRSGWEPRTIRLRQRGIPLSLHSLSEQRSLPRSRSDRRGREAASSHVDDAIHEDMALCESAFEPTKKERKMYLSLFGEPMDFF
jgi:hypothetical protein